MKKQFHFLAIICIALLVLTACNTAKEQNSTAPSTTEGTNAGNDNVEIEEQPTNASDETNSDSKNITYTSNNEQKTEETITVNSEEQHYSMKVLPSFSLTSEEPGKDMLYLTNNDSISMRIETISVNDTTFQELLKNTQEMMNAVDENVKYTDFDIQSYVTNNANIVNAAAYKVDLVDQAVISVIYEKEGQFIRLTIFDNPTADLTDAMIQMGLTITKTN